MTTFFKSKMHDHNDHLVKVDLLKQLVLKHWKIELRNAAKSKKGSEKINQGLTYQMT